MLQKIENITSTGKFRNYQASGDVAFRKLTLIYGDNGSGKTTLTDILRSLSLNKPEIIRSRNSTNSTSPQSAQIIQRDTSGNDSYHTFGTNGWSAILSNIEIFDIHFVNENIYSGFDFNDGHKKSLHQFVIGAQNITVRQQIEENKNDKAISRQNQTAFETQLIEQVNNNLTTRLITEFLNIDEAQANNIDQLISAAETMLTSAKANSIIQTLQPLSNLNEINTDIDFPSINNDLQATSQTIQDDVLQRIFENHCEDLSNNSIESPENWLKIGYKYMENKQKQNGETSSLICPFCKQPIDSNIDIIKSYTIRFNDEFNALVNRLQNYLNSLQNFNIDLILQYLNNIKQNNLHHINSWSTYLSNDIQAPTFNIIENENTLKEQFQLLIEAVKQKIQNPSNALNADAVNIFKNSLDTMNSNIVAYNQNVTNYNNVISTFRREIQTEAQAQAEVDRLKRIKKRFEPDIVAICNQLINERQNLRTLERTYTQLVQQQQTEATTFLNNYKDRINYYLDDVFKTLFKIDNVLHIPPRGRVTQSKINYTLTIDDQEISFLPDQQNSAKSCLSEGDKSTIALAFFLSKLDIDPNINDKIIIFDDPLSSFDSNRRLYTVQLIKNLLPNIEQIIVLSHNEFFLYELSKGIAAGEKKVLRITENFLAKESFIEPLTLENLVENDYFKNIKELENFLINADINKKDHVLGLMRNVLEAHIRFKFYRQTSNLPPNNRTLGRLISTLDTAGVIFRDNLHRTDILSQLRLINGISCKPHHGEPMPDYTVLGVNPNTIGVSELANFVSDTLNLIDSKL